MSRNPIPLSLTAMLLAGTAMADVPKVAVDIAPVHSLVARVMEGLGAPRLIVQPGASPHEYRLRPSEADALQSADLVFWVGGELTPWLGNALQTLAGDAAVTTLLEADGTAVLGVREDALFKTYPHNDDHDHDHGNLDPHAWLSPANAERWFDVIADELSRADPDNAETYLANAAAARAELDAVFQDVNAILDPMRGRQFIVFHDAYQYFETAFDFPASGAISISDAVEPSPARIAEIRARIESEGIACVLSEPQFNPGLVAAVTDGTDTSTAVLDPLGSDLEPGPGLYPQLLRNLAASLAACLS